MVELSDGYQQGIDWSRVRDDGALQFSLTRADVGSDPTSGILPFTLSSQDKRSPLSTTVALNLLRSFGNVKVLSSPRLAVLNHQTALLKVVENIVYFSVKADTALTANVGQNTTVTTTPQSVSVGLVMAVTPQISSGGQIILNVRPTISSIAKFVPDPNPVIPIPNQVPQIRTREMESLLSIRAGDVAVLGGLMEERQEQRTGKLPGLADLPLIGELFTTRNDSSRKSELVVFLRPIIQKTAAPALPTRVADFQEEAAISLDTLDAIGPQDDLLENLTRLQQQHPRSPAIHLALGNFHARRQEWEPARNAYFNAHQLAPRHPTPLLNFSLALEAQGQHELAANFRQRAQQLQAEPPL